MCDVQLLLLYHIIILYYVMIINFEGGSKMQNVQRCQKISSPILRERNLIPEHVYLRIFMCMLVSVQEHCIDIINNRK